MARAMPGPRHPRHNDAMIPASNSRRVSLDEDLRRAEIQRSPSTAPLTVVVTRCTTVTATATTPRLSDRSHRHHNRTRDVVEPDIFHDRARQPTGTFPYALVSHPALPPGSKSS